MIAQGEHVLIRKPTWEQTGSAILRPDGYEEAYAYGRVISIGPKAYFELPHWVDEEDKAHSIQPGDFVVFDQQGARELTLHGTKDSQLVVAHASQIFCLISEKELEARKLPIP